MAGLITRIGQWMDNKWEEKATVWQVSALADQVVALRVAVAMVPPDIQDLKTRLERLELYSGMTRKVDPTKPPVAKSAFAM